jgi:eukaryotic-like serine/threonine-protein kinase
VRFRFGEKVGSGGFGVVKRAEQLAEDRNTVLHGDFAAKFLADDLLEDEEARSRFVREVRLLDDELDHPNIIRIVGRNLSADPPWFVMPFAESNLEQEIEEDGRAGDKAWVVDTFTKILSGVAHAHDREVPILHRDLKPKNILICKGEPRISDFGLGKRLDTQDTGLTRTAMWMGTEPYMAPEQFSDAKRVGTEADVYALGKILCQMLTGQVPEVLFVDLEPLPPEFRFFVEKCCRRAPAERYKTAAEAAAAFAVFSIEPATQYPPIEGAERIVAEWAEAESAEDRVALVGRLDEHLTRNSDDEELYFKVIPRLPDKLVDLYMDEMPEAFADRLTTYDGHMVGGLPFAYCDVVADFYARVFRRTSDLGLQRMTIARLIDIGAHHNRWYVGEVVAELLGEVSDLSLAMALAEVIRENPRQADWFWDPWVKAMRLMGPIADAYASVHAPRA